MADFPEIGQSWAARKRTPPEPNRHLHKPREATRGKSREGTEGGTKGKDEKMRTCEHGNRGGRRPSWKCRRAGRREGLQPLCRGTKSAWAGYMAVARFCSGRLRGREVPRDVRRPLRMSPPLSIWLPETSQLASSGGIEPKTVFFSRSAPLNLFPPAPTPRLRASRPKPASPALRTYM